RTFVHRAPSPAYRPPQLASTRSRPPIYLPIRHRLDSRSTPHAPGRSTLHPRNSPAHASITQLALNTVTALKVCLPNSTRSHQLNHPPNPPPLPHHHSNLSGSCLVLLPPPELANLLSE